MPHDIESEPSLKYATYKLYRHPLEIILSIWVVMYLVFDRYDDYAIDLFQGLFLMVMTLPVGVVLMALYGTSCLAPTKMIRVGLSLGITFIFPAILFLFWFSDSDWNAHDGWFFLKLSAQVGAVIGFITLLVLASSYATSGQDACCGVHERGVFRLLILTAYIAASLLGLVLGLKSVFLIPNYDPPASHSSVEDPFTDLGEGVRIHLPSEFRLASPASEPGERGRGLGLASASRYGPSRTMTLKPVDPDLHSIAAYGRTRYGRNGVRVRYVKEVVNDFKITRTFLTGIVTFEGRNFELNCSEYAESWTPSGLSCLRYLTSMELTSNPVPRTLLDPTLEG